jgi:3-oxoacyl-[acyl-carrier-protein] synthase-1
MADTHYWLTDQNAEHYKAKECTIAQIRLERRSRPAPTPYQIWHPIDCIGEVGSAIAPALMGIGYMAAKHAYAPGPTALMHVGEDNGERAALVLTWSKARV